MQEAIAEQEHLNLTAQAISAQDALERLRRIAFLDVRELFDADGGLVPIKALHDEVTTALRIDVAPDGTVGYRTGDRVRALQILLRHLELVQPQIAPEHSFVPLNVTRVRLDLLTVDELREMRRLLEKAGVPSLDLEESATSATHGRC